MADVGAAPSVERNLQKSQELYKKACDLGAQSGCIYYEQRGN